MQMLMPMPMPMPSGRCHDFQMALIIIPKYNEYKSYSNWITKQKKQNVISYSQIRKIENISGEEISNNYILLISHITLNELVHINRGWGYRSRHNYNNIQL